MAKTFQDSKGRTWTLALTIGRARQVRDVCGADLLQPESGSPSLPEILVDEFRVAAVLEVLLADEFKAKGIDPKCMFQEDWDGQTSRVAYDALLAELASFFEGRGQTSRAAIIRKVQEAILEAMKVVGERAAALDPAAEIRRLMAAADARRIDGPTSGRPPDVPA